MKEPGQLPGSEGDYGDLTKVDATGASEQTAKQDKLTIKGPAASQKMAKTDKKNVDKYKDIIKKVAKEKNIDPAIIAAIISRETRGGTLLDNNGWGDNGNGFGLMQEVFQRTMQDLAMCKPMRTWTWAQQETTMLMM
ncbi:PREDICTED: lysozyme g-like isoform X2 [Branchiostoma belcheri]|uniref:Lysozyme g n=1 Tax=Branchiostoma belcheri TaxID=7741 RepID=A0A6P4YC85_BRABE|nr:PREDICTED: lysozyme g-like isoform X2 [Branchiostoma belcheri]